MKMKKEVRLIKTCVGLVSEYTVLCLADRAIDIAKSADIAIEEALIILLKLSSKGVDAWYDSDKGWYLDFNYKFDYFVVNKFWDDTEIACIFKDNYSIVYSLKKQKFYREYATTEYGDETVKEEIDI